MIPTWVQDGVWHGFLFLAHVVTWEWGRLKPEVATIPSLLTLNNNNTVGGIRAEAVGGRAAILPAVAGLTVDDLDGDDAVSVSDGVDAVV